MMENNQKQSYWHDELMAFGRMSGWVAGPVIIALILGKFLDKKFGTEPKIFLVVIGIGFFASIYGIYIETKKYIKTVEEKSKKPTPPTETVLTTEKKADEK